MFDWKSKSVLVTGGHGFLGTGMTAALKRIGCREVINPRRADFDLTSQVDVQRLFDAHKPDVVFHLAGLVGGILPNKERPADFFYENLLMGSFMLHHAWQNGTQKFIAAGAGCGYPEHAPMPLQEKDFWSGFPQSESAPYSLAKRLLTIQSEAYYRQHGFVSVICIPGNVYGPHDNFRLHDAHVIPALVRKFVEAQVEAQPFVEVWGSGKPSRDFVYVDDVVEGMIRAAEHYTRNEIVNISSGVESNITEVCTTLKELTGFGGDIRWNTERPDGQQRRCFDMTKARVDLGFEPRTDLQTGLQKTVNWYRESLTSALVRR